MSNLKVGDKAVIVKEVCGHQFKIGEIVEIINCYPGCQNYETSNGSDSWHVVMREIKPYTDYLKSNRYTLSQLIKSSEFKAIDLSVQMGKERTYLSSTASESRFNGRGDIAQVKLDEIKLNMSLAELGLKIKRDGLSRETTSKEKPEFNFDIPKKSVEKTAEAFKNIGCAASKFGKPLSDFDRKKIDDDLEDIARDLWKDEEAKKRDHWIYEKPKHNLNIFAILVTIAILVILLSIGYKYIF